MDDGVHPSSGGHACPMDEPLRPGVRDAACRQHGVSTWRQALTEYTPDEVRARVAAGRWRGVLRGTHARRTVPLDDGTVPAAARLVAGRTWSGARARLPRCTGSAWCATTRSTHSGPRAPGRSVRGVRGPGVHQWAADPGDVVGLDGLPVTSAARTAADLARPLSRLGGIAVLDAAAREGSHRPVRRRGGARAEPPPRRGPARPGAPASRRPGGGVADGEPAPTEGPRRRAPAAGVPVPRFRGPVPPRPRVARIPGGGGVRRRCARRPGGDPRRPGTAQRVAGGRWRVFVFADVDVDVDVDREPERIGALLAQALALPVAS